jgi:hypothetical protein
VFWVKKKAKYDENGFLGETKKKNLDFLATTMAKI